MSETRRFEYRLRLPDGEVSVIPVVLDATRLECMEPAPVAREWTALGCNQCPNCPLDPADTPLCPLAARLEPLVARLSQVLSYAMVEAEVSSPGRTITTKSTAQAVASSIMGLIGATSGCPHTAFLKPLAWVHLPLASEEETVFRAVSGWLLKQYFSSEAGQPTDWQLTGLKARYEALHTVNVYLAQRMREATSHDAAVNAIVLLDLFAKAVPAEVDDMLAGLRPYFAHESQSP